MHDEFTPVGRARLGIWMLAGATVVIFVVVAWKVLA